jgi:hypothetical protein
MNEGEDVRTIQRLAPGQSGVFRLEDLRTALGEPHRAALYRRIDRLIALDVLARCTRATYVAESFDLAVLSQRIAPDSAVSFETVLADALVIGPKPSHRISAIRGGRSATYAVRGLSVEHFHVAADMRFGEESRNGVRHTVPEKALLDVLSFHLRGRRALFDLHTDVRIDALDRVVLREFLTRYRNPRFVAFARDVLRFE